MRSVSHDTVMSENRGGPPRRASPLLMWSLVAVVGAIICAVFVVARTLGIRIALEAAAGLVTLYAAMAALLTAAHAAALHDTADRHDEASRHGRS